MIPPRKGEKVVIAGGNGYLGRVLTRHLLGLGCEVVLLCRRPAPGPWTGAAREIYWNGEDLGDWARELEGARAVINLAGRSVNCRYTAANRKAIYASRLRSTALLGEAIRGCQNPPPVWLNSSSATIYRHAFDRAMDETDGEILDDAGKPGEEKWAFSVDVCKRWEEALKKEEVPGTRKIALRTAMVFGDTAGGVYEVLARLARLGLGGPMGGGDQYVSFISEPDFARAVTYLIGPEALDGAVNLAAPEPLTNREMMARIRHHAGVAIGLPATRWMLELGAIFLRTETELILKSRKVVSRRLAGAGFRFEHPDFATLLDSIPRPTRARNTGSGRHPVASEAGSGFVAG